MAKRRPEDPEVEVVAEEAETTPAGSLEQSLIIATTIALLIGIVVGLMELGKHYGTGPFAG